MAAHASDRGPGAKRLRRITRRRLNFYDVLQISPAASPDVIRAAYRTLARTTHPDLNQEESAPAHMSDINAAYETLSNPERRMEYDAYLDRMAGLSRLVHSPANAGRGSDRLAIRAALTDAQRPPSRPVRAGLLVVLILALAAVVLVVLWLAYDALDEGSPYAITTPAARSHSQPAAQPVLNFV